MKRVEDLPCSNLAARACAACTALLVRGRVAWLPSGFEVDT